MSKVKIIFEISKENLINALQNAGSGFSLKLKKDINLEELEETISSDISNYFNLSLNFLTEFLEEGLNNDLYREFFKE
jgi:hypothetical protein